MFQNSDLKPKGLASSHRKPDLHGFNPSGSVVVHFQKKMFRFDLPFEYVLGPGAVELCVSTIL